MGVLGIIGGALMGGGLLGALIQKRPKFNSGPMDEAYGLINDQYNNVNSYFDEANTAFEGQYQHYYGQQMQDAVNAIAGNGIFESPVSENVLNRNREALSEQYATGKSQLAGQKMSAIGSIDQQKIAYFQNLASLQHQRAMEKQQSNSQLFGEIGAIGAALL